MPAVDVMELQKIISVALSISFYIKSIIYIEYIKMKFFTNLYKFLTADVIQEAFLIVRSAANSPGNNIDLIQDYITQKES